MATITCYECGKKYNYADDGFCPRCGSFNQPRRGSYIVSASGDIVRTDGINEASHENSFVHKEYHAEEHVRKKLGLDRDMPTQKTAPRRTAAASKTKKSSPVGTVFLIVWLAALFLILFPTVFSLL